MRVSKDVSTLYTYMVFFRVLSTHSNKVGGQQKLGLSPEVEELSTHSTFPTNQWVASKS